ncbi:MAG: metalloregulator ArsR/SmtB family transcription factor [Pseudomonadota bacterium]
MDDPIATHARALAALGHEARLTVFRALVRAGEDGLNVGEIAALTGLPASTLAHHLRALVTAGLVTQTKRGRAVVNRVDFPAANRTADFLLAECCTAAGLARDDAA